MRSRGISIIHVNKTLTYSECTACGSLCKEVRFGRCVTTWLAQEGHGDVIVRLTIFQCKHMGSRNYGYLRFLFEIRSLKMKLILPKQ